MKDRMNPLRTHEPVWEFEKKDICEGDTLCLDDGSLGEASVADLTEYPIIRILVVNRRLPGDEPGSLEDRWYVPANIVG